MYFFPENRFDRNRNKELKTNHSIPRPSVAVQSSTYTHTFMILIETNYEIM